MTRSSGVLLPIHSLPSPYGIGTIGKSAYDFVDFLKAAGQKYWQILPIGFTDAAGSPYSSVSTFAGNPAYIDLDMLEHAGMLDKTVLSDNDFSGNAGWVSREAVIAEREKLLYTVYKNGRGMVAAEMSEFRAECDWLHGFALYMALRRHFEGKPWYEWPEEIRARRPDAVVQFEETLCNEIDYQEFLQLLFFRQWRSLRDYAHKNGIRILGDVPIYVAADSADVWLEPWFFKLDERFSPVDVAGVPPDYFCEDGQLWGNPFTIGIACTPMGGAGGFEG